MRNKHLTRDQVLFIRAMYRVYYEVDEIAEHMGYSEKTVRDVINWRTHRRVIDMPVKPLPTPDDCYIS